MSTDEEIKEDADLRCVQLKMEKNNGHTIQKDCVTVFISVVLPTLLRQLFTGADCGWQPAPQQDERSVHGTESRKRR